MFDMLRADDVSWCLKFLFDGAGNIAADSCIKFVSKVIKSSVRMGNEINTRGS